MTLPHARSCSSGRFSPQILRYLKSWEEILQDALLKPITPDVDELLNIQQGMVHPHLEHLEAGVIPSSNELKELQEMRLHKLLE